MMISSETLRSVFHSDFREAKKKVYSEVHKKGVITILGKDVNLMQCITALTALSLCTKWL